MDTTRFDALTRALAVPTRRRAALGLLGAGILGGLLPARAGRAAQRPDRDFDGLFDDDEVDVYGTHPDVFDTDGDGDGDGLEVYNGTDPLAAPGGTGLPAAGGLNQRPAVDGGCAPGLTQCSGFCVDVTNDFFNCGMCSNRCLGRAGGYCENNFCVYPCIQAGTC